MSFIFKYRIPQLTGIDQCCCIAFMSHELTHEVCVDKSSEFPSRGNVQLPTAPSSLLLPQAMTTWHCAQCSSTHGPNRQRTALQGLVVPGFLRLLPQYKQVHCFSVIGFRQQEFFVWRVLLPVHSTLIDSCFALSLRYSVFFLTFSGISSRSPHVWFCLTLRSQQAQNWPEQLPRGVSTPQSALLPSF